MKAYVLSLVLALAVVAGPVAAGPFSDLVMSPGILAEVSAGPVFRYAHERRLPAHAAGEARPGADRGLAMPKAVVGGALIVTAEPDGQGMNLVLTRDDGTDIHPVAAFPAKGPNPVLLFFLENTMRVMAAETGGSPFYFRNRIREALATAPLPTGDGTVVLHPFEGDKNQARMGDLATLALHFRIDPAMPGRLIELKADTAAGARGYTETLTLVPEE